jgi:hypothetical protein
MKVGVGCRVIGVSQTRAAGLNDDGGWVPERVCEVE